MLRLFLHTPEFIEMKALLFAITTFSALLSLNAQTVANRVVYYAGGVATGGGGGGGSAMTNGVVAHWEMKADTSANEVDEMGANDLTVSAGDTIPSAAAVVGNGRDFEDGEDDYMSIADNADLSMSGDPSFTLLFWLRLESVSATRAITHKGTDGGNNAEYALYFNNSGSTFGLTIGNGSTNRTLTTTRAHGTGTNYFLAAIYNATNDTAQLLVCEPAGNNLVSTNYTQGSHDSGGTLYFGAFAHSLSLNFDGIADEVTVAKRAFTTNEVITLYNSGSGQAWPWSGL
jgi:hypothetical protein